VRVCLNKNIT